MEVWVALSLGAAFLQNLRTALQKALAEQVGVLGATYARFLFAAPWAVLLVAVLVLREGAPMPGMTGPFVLWALVGAVAQIAATGLLLRLFRLRNFAVGNTFARTEAVQAAVFGLVLLGDRIAALPLAGIVISLAGVTLMSTTHGIGGGVLNRAAAMGLACGAAFALSAVAYRAAALALADSGGLLIRPAFTLACVTLLQTLLMSGWMAVRAPWRVWAVLAHWRLAAPVGIAGMLASLGWFTAFALVPAAQVKAVGQVELLFNYLTSHLAFRERPTGRETLGIALVAAGILLLVLTT
jgi:drug/metabolite transporter (DMT)-like permease